MHRAWGPETPDDRIQSNLIDHQRLIEPATLTMGGSLFDVIDYLNGSDLPLSLTPRVLLCVSSTPMGGLFG